MRITLDKEYLQKVTKGEHKLLITEEQHNVMERIKGMIMNDMRFCSLVTGYRGTGKSTYVKYILDEFDKEDSNISVISFNAAKYRSYEVFIKRFIRELYFKLNSKNMSTEQLKKMYYHTFFDIKESFHNDFYVVDKEVDETVDEWDMQLKGKINIILLLKIACYVLLSVLILQKADSLILIACFSTLFLIGLFAEFVDINAIINKIYRKKVSACDEEQKKKGRSSLAESLYDNEITEYYVFDELEKIDKSGRRLIFVIDELDKVDDKELDMIFHDLKPLLLSNYCNFVLIAGRNMVKYLNAARNNIDSISTSIFTNEIYLPLSTIQDMRDFAECFYSASAYKNRTYEFYADRGAQQYFNVKIFKAKGIKRAFVNGILDDIKWDNEIPYIDVNTKEISQEFLQLFGVLENMEEYVLKNYRNEQRDELIQTLYCCLERIQDNRHRTFTQTDILGKKEDIEETIIYSTVADQMNLFHMLIDYMVKTNMIEQNGEFYNWCMDVLIKLDPSDEMPIDDEIFKEYIEMFMKHWEEIENVLCCFARYNGIDVGAEYNYSTFRKLIIAMIPSFDMEESELHGALACLEQLYEDGVGKEDLDAIREYSTKMADIKRWLIDKLLEYTFRTRLESKSYDVWNDNKSFDLMYRSKKTYVFIEVKYYRDYLKLINKALIYKLLGKATNCANLYRLEQYKLKLAVFTDIVDTEEMRRFETRCIKILNEFQNKDNLQICLFPFNDYEQFKRNMDLLCAD